MNYKTSYLVSALALFAAASANAVVLASTDFDGRTLSPSNTANDLNWTLNALDDPGSMAALDDVGGAQTIFNGETFTQNHFTPGVNVGNTNSFWTTEVSLTVSSGFNVTFEDVTLNVVSVNGGEALNVNRDNDFTLTLFNPSGVSVEAITLADITSGTTAVPNSPLVTFDFTDVALTLPGTYTLQIKGGDFAGGNETGNHTGFDNLSINGSFSAVPEPSAAILIGLGGLGIMLRRRR